MKGHPGFWDASSPEFKSKPFDPHPLFRDFIKASLKGRQERQKCKKK